MTRHWLVVLRAAAARPCSKALANQRHLILPGYSRGNARAQTIVADRLGATLCRTRQASIRSSNCGSTRLSMFAVFRFIPLRGCEPIHFGIAEEGTRMTSAGYMISSFDCIAEVVGPQQQQDRIRWSVTLPRGSFRRAGDTLYPSATALAAAARSATARIRLCATANHNNTARTLSRPRSSRRWKPRLRRSALTHSALARWR